MSTEEIKREIERLHKNDMRLFRALIIAVVTLAAICIYTICSFQHL